MDGNLAVDVSGSVSEKQKETPVCGVVMPISTIDGCSESHWTEVLAILSDAIDSAGFSPNIVSNADEVGIIQKRIIQNLYDNPVVVCDVSGKNPNVMFELGLRLAFDKPTIIVKDDQTDYSFDTSQIEHLQYPRDLRFAKIVEFKNELSKKIVSTFDASQKDKNYTTFLKHFGAFKVAKIDEKEVSGQEFLMEEISYIKNQISRLGSRNDSFAVNRVIRDENRGDICIAGLSFSEAKEFSEIACAHAGVREVRLRKRSDDHYHLVFWSEASWFQTVPKIEDDLMQQFDHFRNASRIASRRQKRNNSLDKESE